MYLLWSRPGGFSFYDDDHVRRNSGKEHVDPLSPEWRMDVNFPQLQVSESAATFNLSLALLLIELARP